MSLSLVGVELHVSLIIVEYMNGQAETVYLKAETDVLYKHLLMGKSVRPLLLNKTADEVNLFIREQIKHREPFLHKG